MAQLVQHDDDQQGHHYGHGVHGPGNQGGDDDCPYEQGQSTSSSLLVGRPRAGRRPGSSVNDARSPLKVGRGHAALDLPRTASPARARARRSASSTASTSSRGLGDRLPSVSSTTAAIPDQDSFPARKAATATSLAAFSQAGESWPWRPAG